jgi:bifunctional non-homologous end joining protein LigD
MKLAEYRRKRDAARTNEPFGAEPARPRAPTVAGPFVVHLHDATRTHYDLRLGVGGVLASFAVPKGPSLDPEQKHLAIHTEDHPIEYLDFEAVISEESYGAGPMIVWDRGSVRYLDGSAEEGLEKGKLDFVLSGYKLRGRFALVRLKNEKTQWLLFKKKDAFSSTTRDLQAEEPRSVLSGLTVAELAAAPRLARAIEARAAEHGAPAREGPPRFVAPMLCGAAAAPVADPGFLYELKLDGVRIVAVKDGHDVSLTYRSKRDATASYPEITRAVRALAAPRLVLDGEIAAFDEAGRPSFQRLGHRIHLTRASDVRRATYETPVVYVVFDLLAIGARDLTGLPLVTRKALLRELMPGGGVVRALDHLEDDGAPLLAFCRAQHLEGVVAKRKTSLYRPGPRRSDDWLKLKCERDEDFVVVGVTRGGGGRRDLGALDIATYQGDDLVLRGKVGSGFDDRTIELLLGLLEPLGTPMSTARGKLVPAPRGRTFVRPELVVRVRFLGWSDEGQVRFPVFHGIRNDVAARDCTAGPPVALEELARAAPPVAEEPEPPPGVASREGGARRVAITNRNKLFWPAEGLTKGDLIAYYEAVAPVLLPYLRDRPVVLVRYPDGVEGKSFFQWNVPPGLPSWVQTLKLPPRGEDKHEKHVFLINDVDSLLHIANLACIPIHILACRAESLDVCDFVTIDFDLKGPPLPGAVELAHTLRGLLGAAGLAGYAKTSGQTGLHVLVPLGPSVSFDAARALADLLGRLVVARHPKTATMERIVSKRNGRILVDTGQVGPARTIVSPYSVRAAPRATVSTPLAWDEVTPALEPGLYTIRSLPERLEARGDPMATMLADRPDLGAALVAIERLVSGKA